MVSEASTMVLVHSPFLGPSSLQPLADQLDADGLPVVVPDLRTAVVSEPAVPKMCAAVAAALRGLGTGPLVLVGHSGTGPLLPAMADAVDGVVALVYLDAGLPTPGQSWRETAPPELVEDLLARAGDTRLPLWHRWFDGDPLAELVPDARLRGRLVADEPEVPVAFLAEPRPVVEWAGRAGYLQLSPPYASAAERAEQLGWPTRRLDAHHLAPATDPRPVADALRDLCTALAA